MRSRILDQFRVRQDPGQRHRPRGSRSTIQLQALVARALEAWIIGKHHMAALLANKPAWPLDHRLEAVTHYAIWTSNDRVIHFSLPFSRPRDEPMARLASLNLILYP